MKNKFEMNQMVLVNFHGLTMKAIVVDIHSPFYSADSYKSIPCYHYDLFIYSNGSSVTILRNEDKIWNID